MHALQSGTFVAYAELKSNPSLSDDALIDIFVRAACSGQRYSEDGSMNTADENDNTIINGSAPRIPRAQLLAAVAAIRRDATIVLVDDKAPYDMTLDKGPNSSDAGAAGGVGNFWVWRKSVDGSGSLTTGTEHAGEGTTSIHGSVNVAYAGATPKTCWANALNNHTISLADGAGKDSQVNGDLYNLTANALKSTNLDLAEFRASCPSVDVLCVDEFLKHSGKIPKTADGNRSLDGSCGDASMDMVEVNNCEFPLCKIRAPWTCTDWCPGDRYQTEYDSAKWKLVYVGDQVANCCGSPLFDPELGVLTKVADQREFLPGPGNPGWAWEQQCCTCDGAKAGVCEHLIKCPLYKKETAAGCNSGATGTQYGGSCGGGC
jgi:hypothetical protein